MGWDDILSDVILPVAGGAAGLYFGGTPAWAGIGAGAGRYLGGEVKGEESSNQLTNSLLSGGLGYGGGAAINAAGSSYLNGYPFMGEFKDQLGFSPSSMTPSAAGGSSGPSGGSLMSNLSGGNMIPIMMGAGLLSELGSGKARQEDDYQKQLASALEGATWNDATRSKYMSSIKGSLNDSLAAGNKRTAAVGAEAGRGGGFFSNKTARNQADVNEAVAKSLSSTYQPYGTDVAQLKAKAVVSPQTLMERLLGGVGDVAGKWPYLALANAYSGR